MRFSSTIVVLMIGLAGCATVPVEKRFDDFKNEAESETGLPVSWQNVSADEAAVAEAVTEMLADELSIEEAVHIALLYNKDLQATYAGFGIALSDLIQAGLPSNPVAEIAVRFQEDSAFNLRTWEVNIAQDFLDILLIPLKKKVAKAEFERTKLEVTRSVIGHATDTRIAFYQVQAAQQLHELMQSVLLAGEAAFEMAFRLFTAGNITEAELLAERARYEQTKLSVAESEMMIADAREDLNKQMGLWGVATGWKTDPRLPPPPTTGPDLENLEQRVIDKSLDLQIAWFDVEATARRNRIRSVESVLPEFTLGAQFERDPEIKTEIRQNGRGEPELRDSKGPDLWWRGPNATIPIPLFDQGQATRTKGRMAVRREWDKFTALAVNLRATARKTGYEIEYTRNRALYYERVMLPLQHRLRVQMQLRYNAMFLGVFQLLDAKRDEISTARDYVGALRDFWIARAKMEGLLLGRMPEGDGVMPGAGGEMTNNSRGQGGH